MTSWLQGVQRASALWPTGTLRRTSGESVIVGYTLLKKVCNPARVARRKMTGRITVNGQKGKEKETNV